MKCMNEEIMRWKGEVRDRKICKIESEACE